MVKCVHSARLCQDDFQNGGNLILAGFVYTHPSCARAVGLVVNPLFYYQINLIDGGGCVFWLLLFG